MSNKPWLEKLDLPAELRHLSNKEISELIAEIRALIIETAQSHDLHYSSNLGIVELSTMILKVFDVHTDKILYDTGHQTYAHKILTGRYKKFKTMREPNGLAGLMNMDESKHDHYSPGHSGNILSVASGLYQAYAQTNASKDNPKKYINNKNIVAVVGDAAFANGLNFEALNDISYHKEPLIIILNDNEMSISKPVGSMAKMFSRLQSLQFFHLIERVLARTFNYNATYFAIYKSAIWMQTRLIGKNLFQNLGYHYIGPIDGHNLKHLEGALKRARWFAKQGSVIVHVKTIKGKGDLNAENDITGSSHSLNKNVLKSFGMYATDYLLELMNAYEDIRVINPAMILSSNCQNIIDAFPHRFTDVGISEEHALSKASGMALAGLKVYVYIYSSFLQRGYDQLLHDISRLGLSCTLLIDRADLNGYDGASHHGIYDVGFLKTIKDVVITSPRNINQLKQLLAISYQHQAGIFAIRYPKNNAFMLEHNEYQVTTGKWESMNLTDSDVVIVSYGPYVNEIYNNVAKPNNLNLVNAIFITGYDRQQLLDILKKYKHIIVYERIYGDSGLVHDFYQAANELQVSTKIYGLHYQTHIEHNSEELLDAKHHMDCDSLIVFLKQHALIH